MCICVSVCLCVRISWVCILGTLSPKSRDVMKAAVCAALLPARPRVVYGGCLHDLGRVRRDARRLPFTAFDLEKWHVDPSDYLMSTVSNLQKAVFDQDAVVVLPGGMPSEALCETTEILAERRSVRSSTKPQTKSLFDEDSRVLT